MSGTKSSYLLTGSNATPIPLIDLSVGVSIPITNKAVLDGFSTLAPALQRYAVEVLRGLLQDIRRDGSVAHLIKLGVVDSQKYQLLQAADTAKLKSDLLFEFHWKLVQYLRFSTPPRITDAIPILEQFSCQPVKDSFHILLGFYGAVAFSRLPGKEDQSINLYMDTVNEMIHGGTIAPILTLLWVKANIARLARRMNDITLAEKEEKYVRSWILSNPWILSPDEMFKLIADEIGTGANILDHPDVNSLFAYLRGLASAGEYKPMMGPVNSNVDQVIVDNLTQVMCFDVEPFPLDPRFRVR